MHETDLQSSINLYGSNFLRDIRYKKYILF